jgi:hypothetical protein
MGCQSGHRHRGYLCQTSVAAYPGNVRPVTSHEITHARIDHSLIPHVGQAPVVLAPRPDIRLPPGTAAELIDADRGEA